MKAKLYVLLGAHPSRTAMLMLEHKGIEYETTVIPPPLHPFVVRLAGFRADPAFSRQVDDRSPSMLRRADRMGTVPALRLGGRRAMTNRNIARLLDELQPDPPLFPADADLRREVEEAERWGDEVFQMIARRLLLTAGLPGGVGLVADGDEGRLGPLLFRSRLLRRACARFISVVAFRANAETEAAMLADLPGMLDRIDAWIEAGILDGDELNAADYMIVTSLAMLTYRLDVAAEIARRPANSLLDRVLPDAATAPASIPLVAMTS
jgi:glutathione S-transferase